MAVKAKPKTPKAGAVKAINREAMRLTFSLLRKPCPSAALAVRNLIMQHPELKTKDPADVISITLTDEQIERVVQTLLALCLIESQCADSSKLATLRELLNGWMAVANEQHLFEEID